MEGWVLAAAMALLWLQLAPLGGVGARQEPKRPRQPSQRTVPLNATVPNGQEPLSFPKQQAQYAWSNLLQKVVAIGVIVNVLELPEASGPEFSDARKTWLDFVGRSDDTVKKRCRARDKKSEFQEMLKEATERRFLELLGPLLPEGPGGRLVAEAFHCQLKGPVLVDKKMLVELQGFQAPAAQGAFLRGSGLSLASGRFTAPVSAIFQFSASLHVDLGELRGKLQLRARDMVRVLICIESLCHHHMSLETITGLESNSRVLTVHVQGLLQLQAGQSASVFVDNGSGATLTIQSSSSFSGLLLGM